MRAGHALVLFSGGQDSTICLAWALERFALVETVGFDYGQRHHVEMQARVQVLGALRTQFPAWGERLGQDHVIDLSVLGRISDTALTRDVAIQMDAAGLPNTFVPGRNLLFFSSRRLWATGAGCTRSWAVCAKRIIRATPIAATTPSRRCRWPCRWAWASTSLSRRR